NTPSRLAALKSDPWEDFRAAAKPIPEGARATRRRPGESAGETPRHAGRSRVWSLEHDRN
ncbi:MAG TPA: hypothetical protein VGC51_08855, partial [Hansschlegelia sp.]